MAMFEILVDEEGYVIKGQQHGLKAVVDKLIQMEASLNQMHTQLNEIKAKVDNVAVGKLILADKF